MLGAGCGGREGAPAAPSAAPDAEAEEALAPAKSKEPATAPAPGPSPPPSPPPTTVTPGVLPPFPRPLPPSSDLGGPEPRTLEEALARLEASALELETLWRMRAGTPLDAGMCLNVCASLASLRRAAAAVCRLAGDGDDRCRRATERLRDSERRAREAGCPC
jgi:hypothetical protein